MVPRAGSAAALRRSLARRSRQIDLGFGFVEIGKYADAGERILTSRGAAARLVRTSATFCWNEPLASAAAMPPAASISRNSAQAARQSWSVKSSTAPEPAAGSATLARWDSSRRTSWVLRAMRRAKRSGNPSAAVNGKTVIASAPPSAAANAAIVARRIFTCGSRRAIIRQAVSAETNAGSGASPHASSTRAHNFRSARNFAMVRN